MKFAWEIKHDPCFTDGTEEYAQLPIGGDELIIHIESPRILKNGSKLFKFYIRCTNNTHTTYWIKMCNDAHYTNIQDAIEYAEHIISERFNDFAVALNN